MFSKSVGPVAGDPLGRKWLWWQGERDEAVPHHLRRQYARACDAGHVEYNHDRGTLGFGYPVSGALRPGADHGERGEETTMAKLMRVLVWPDGDVTRADLDTDGTREYVREAVASGATVVEDGEGLYYQAHPRAATAAAYQGVRS